jgi:hypothetical protein
MDEIVMLRYLSWLNAALNLHPCALVMDSFPAHYTPLVGYKARALGIEVIPVPRGWTGKYQPLDRRPFGALKAISQRMWDEIAAKSSDLKWNHVEAAKLLEAAWAKLGHEAIERGWSFTGTVNPFDARAETETDEFDGYDQLYDAEREDPSDRRFTVGDFKASRLSDSDDEELSNELMEGLLEKLQRARDRQALHQPLVDQVVNIRLKKGFDDQPTISEEEAEAARWQFRPDKWKYPDGISFEEESRMRAAVARLQGIWGEPFGLERCARRYDDPTPPIGDDGWTFPQGVHARVGESTWFNP